MRNRIIFTLISSIFVIFLTPRVEVLNSNSVLLFSIFLVILFGLSVLYQPSKLDSGILIVFLACILGGSLMAGSVEPELQSYAILLPTSAFLAYMFLSFALLIGPVAQLLPSKFSFIYKWRRHVGVAALLAGLAHFSIVLSGVFGDDLMAVRQIEFTGFGTLGLLIMGLLALSSWDYVQKRVSLTSWSGIYIVLVGVYLWLAMNAISNFPNSEYKLIWILGGLWLVLVSPISMKAWLKLTKSTLNKLKVKQIDGWKQLHRLIYLAYASVIIHMWMGVIQSRADYIQALFGLSVIVIVLLHALTTFRKLWMLNKHRLGQRVELGDDTYFQVSATSSFIPGRGQQFFVAGMPIAIFSTGQKFIALYDKCQHQGGPLHQGHIEDGYVVCPWHGWQYGVEDGCGPDGFHDSVPYFPTLVQEDTLFVSLNPVAKPEHHQV